MGSLYLCCFLKPVLCLDTRCSLRYFVTNCVLYSILVIDHSWPQVHCWASFMPPYHFTTEFVPFKLTEPMKVGPSYLETMSWLVVSTNSKEPSYLANYWIVPGSSWHPFSEPLERHHRLRDSHSYCEWLTGSDCGVHCQYEVWTKISIGVYLCNSIIRHPYLAQTDRHVSSNWCSTEDQ